MTPKYKKTHSVPSQSPKARPTAKSRTRPTKPAGRPRLRATSHPEARTILHELAATKNGERAAKVEKVLLKHGKAKVSLRQVGKLKTGTYRLLPAQPKERQEALAASIERHGIIIPVVADEQGNIIAGEFSYEYAKEHDIRCSVLIVRFTSEADKWELALALNPPTRQLDRAERESLIETYLRKDPQIAPNNLADLIGGTSKNKVAAIQQKLIADGEIPHFDKLRGHDGRYRTGTLPPRIIANSPSEIKSALSMISALPPNTGSIMDTTTAKQHAVEDQPTDNGSFQPRPFLPGCNSPDRKKNDIPTPPGLCQFLYDLIWPHHPAKVILDPCAGGGNLTLPWQKKVKRIVPFEIKHGKDFFQCDQKLDEVELVLCNPPFNNNPDGKLLFPWKFLLHILKLVPPNTPIVLFVPFGFVLNTRTKTKNYAGQRNRYEWLRDECPPITSFVPLPSNVFAQPGVDRTSVHSLILFFNMPTLAPCYLVPDKYLIGHDSES